MWPSNNQRHRLAQAGFTYIELIIVMAIFLSVAAISLDVYGNLAPGTSLRESAYRILGDMRRAQGYSVAASDNTSYGVYIDDAAKQSVFYRGSAYASREPGYDQLYAFDPSITVILPLANKDFNFGKFTGFPNQTGDIRFVGPVVGTTTIRLNAFGVMDFD